jgi:hypothetical protein
LDFIESLFGYDQKRILEVLLEILPGLFQDGFEISREGFFLYLEMVEQML